MSAPTEDAVARLNRALRESEERDVDHISLNVDESDLHAVLARLAECERGIKAVAELINESRGVFGLHLNGDIAPWSDLQTGGRYEEWLRDFDHAMRGGA